MPARSVPLVEGGAVGDVQLRTDFAGHHVGEGCLSESRRAMQKRVVDRFIARSGRLDGDTQLADQRFLSDILRESFGAKRIIILLFLRPL